MSGRINIPWQQFTVLFMRIYRPESQASRFLAEPYGMEEEEYVGYKSFSKRTEVHDRGRRAAEAPDQM
jgi:hypothetical protein